MLKSFVVVLAAVGCVSGFSTPAPPPTTTSATTTKTGYRIDGCRDLVSEVFQVDECLPAWKTCCPGGTGLFDGKPAICSLSELNCKANRTDDESCHGQWMRKNCANFCGLCIEDDECPWFDQDSGIDDLVVCNDGTKCKDLVDNEESCCRHHAGIATCPKNRKFMCNDGFSCSGNTEHCCVSDYTKCHFMGGVKTCKGKDDPRIPEEDHCTTPFNNADNFLKLATIFLAGPVSPVVRSTESPSACAWECINHGEACKAFSYFQPDENGRGNCFLFYGTLSTDGYKQIKSDDATFYHRINFDCIIATTTTSTTTDTGSGDGTDFLDDDDALETTDTTSLTVSTRTASTKSTISTTTSTVTTTTTTAATTTTTATTTTETVTTTTSSSVTSSSISSTTESTISSSTVSSSTTSTGTSSSVTTQTTATNTSTRTTISVTIPTETTTTTISDTSSSSATSSTSTSTSSSTSSLSVPMQNSSSTTAGPQSTTSVAETTIEPEAETTTASTTADVSGDDSSGSSGDIPADNSETTEMTSTPAANTKTSSSETDLGASQDSTDIPMTSKKSDSTTVLVVSTLDDNEEEEIFETANGESSSSSSSTTYIAAISVAVIIVLIGLILIVYRARKSRYEQPVTFSHADVVDNGTITKAEFEAGVIPALQAAGKGDRETITFRKAGGVKQTANNDYEFEYEFDDNSRGGDWAQRNEDAPQGYGFGGYSSDFSDTDAALRSHHDGSRTSVANGIPQRFVVNRSDVKEIDEFSGPEYDESDFGFGTVSTAIQGYTSPGGRNSSTSPRKSVEVIDEISI